MLAHEDGGVRVMKQIAGDTGKLCEYVGGDLGVSLRRHEDAETRKSVPAKIRTREEFPPNIRDG